ncbi:hypothetical protein Vadar_024472 [Vaccinium darrowii]|uniref:Uncharacterized protein n=1 Tax=Vaccinium darrowii TaxID=229202 RepID=A0ACB7Y9D4_9ERIC|nr:hypothetical protein Vadar_024472 [Vaccinium darrowii]
MLNGDVEEFSREVTLAAFCGGVFRGVAVAAGCFRKVAKCVNQCAELIRQRTCNATISALEVISGVLPISSYSEKLLEMKGEALLMLGRYEEVIQLCEQTLVFVEKNVATTAYVPVASSNFYE